MALDLGAGAAARRPLWPLGAGAAGVLLVVAGFFASAHLGYELRDAETGAFMSYHSREGLAALSAARARTWGDHGPPPQGQFSREDQYLSEALWHVRRRNEAMEDARPRGGVARESDSGEVPSRPSCGFRRPTGLPLTPCRLTRWRGCAPGRAAAAGGRSDANPIAIYTWRRRQRTGRSCWRVRRSWYC